MFEKMLLLMPSEIREPISQQLLAYNPKLDVVPVDTLDELRALTPAVLRRARLIAFTSPLIVPVDCLAAIGYGAYNFHPGPPSYPGLAPAAFAIYEGAQIFGATAHAMVAKVDAGPIVGIELGRVAAGAAVVDLELMSFGLLARIFHRLAKDLATNPQPLPELSVAWSTDKSSRRTLTAICDIAPDISAAELEQRIRAFAGNHFGIQPTITLHGHKFRLVSEPKDPAVIEAIRETVANAVDPASVPQPA